MRSSVTADIVCVFELRGTQTDAQKFILGRLRETAGAKDFRVSSVRVIRWCDPSTNLAREYVRSGVTRTRFTVQISVNFTLDGSYPEAQKWVLDQLMDNEPETLMNVESVNLYCSPVVEVP